MATRKTKRAATRRRRSTTSKRTGAKRSRGFKGISVSSVIAGAGALNAMSSILTGRDLMNGGVGETGVRVDDAKMGARGDVIKLLSRSDMTMSAKLAGATRYWMAHAQSAVTTTKGAARTFGPLAVGVGVKTAVKIAKPNKYIPAKVRRYVRF